MKQTITCHPATRSLHVVVEDDFGVEHRIQAHAGTDRCPMCQREYPQTKGEPDLDKLITEVIASLDVETEKVIAVFEKHGMDVTAAKTRLLERRAKAK